MIKDSGNRTQYNTGAVRDIQENKGRCDLMPLEEIAECYAWFDVDEETIDENYMDYIRMIFKGLSEWQRDKTNRLLVGALENFKRINEDKWETAEEMFLDVSLHYKQGAKKYGERNWEKGIPTHSYLDSAIRHLLKFEAGHTDERHDRAFAWNILGLMWTMNNKPELDDVIVNPIEDEGLAYTEKEELIYG